MNLYDRMLAVFTAVLAILGSGLAMAGEPSDSLLTPDNHSLILIDHQPQMAFATRSHSIEDVRNNVTGLGKAAKAFNVPTILTTVAEKSFSGPIFPELQCDLARTGTYAAVTDISKEMFNASEGK